MTLAERVQSSSLAPKESRYDLGSLDEFEDAFDREVHGVRQEP